MNYMKDSLYEIFEYVSDLMLRGLCSFIWMAFLCVFSFYDLIDFAVHTSGHSISMEIVSEMQSLKMVIANIGLIGMVYVDNIIASMLTKHHNESAFQRILLVVAIVIALMLALISQGMDIEQHNFRYESLPGMMFAIYLVTLFVYKVQSLEVSHTQGRAF